MKTVQSRSPSYLPSATGQGRPVLSSEPLRTAPLGVVASIPPPRKDRTRKPQPPTLARPAAVVRQRRPTQLVMPCRTVGFVSSTQAQPARWLARGQLACWRTLWRLALTLPAGPACFGRRLSSGRHAYVTDGFAVDFLACADTPFCGITCSPCGSSAVDGLPLHTLLAA